MNRNLLERRAIGKSFLPRKETLLLTLFKNSKQQEMFITLICNFEIKARSKI